EGLARIALQNLLNNAWKYTSKVAQPHVEIGLLTGMDNSEFYIRDNGVGFDMKYAKNLFLPFQRLHSEHEFEGDGVGLATTWRVIMRHGGSIRAESSPDQGATFYFSFGKSRPIRRRVI
ncbi:MAG TPA: ATP-binding protein, partial [Methylotenera sp.]|nr:ATP-binding protein [Methylotenera sp.]